MSVDKKELAICKRRGHSSTLYPDTKLWAQCEWCGMWVRAIRSLEEREDTPPEEERHLFSKLCIDPPTKGRPRRGK